MKPGLTLRALSLICLAGAGWAFSFGFGTQLVSHWLMDEMTARRGIDRDTANLVIGFNHAIYYLGRRFTGLARLDSALGALLCRDRDDVVRR